MVLVIVVIVLIVVIVVVDSIWANFTFSTIWPFYEVMLWPLRVARWLLSLYLQFVHILFYSLPFYSILYQCLLVVGQKVACRPKETLETLPCSSNVVLRPISILANFHFHFHLLSSRWWRKMLADSNKRPGYNSARKMVIIIKSDGRYTYLYLYPSPLQPSAPKGILDILDTNNTISTVIEQ